jgi:hypothetical protein
MRCFMPLKRMRTREKDISFRIILLCECYFMSNTERRTFIKNNNRWRSGFIRGHSGARSRRKIARET